MSIEPVCPDNPYTGIDPSQLSVQPDAADDALCAGLVDRSRACSPDCPVPEQDQCALSWACARLSVRADMLADLYACMPHLPCAIEDDALFVTCVEMVGSKYPPTDAQTTFEAAFEKKVVECGGMPGACADGSCGGWSDDLYGVMTACIQDNSDCLAVALCMAIADALIESGKCTSLGSGGAGGAGAVAGSGGAGGSGGGEPGGSGGGSEGG